MLMLMRRTSFGGASSGNLIYLKLFLGVNFGFSLRVSGCYIDRRAEIGGKIDSAACLSALSTMAESV